jgi:hypothetical protein
MLQAYLYMYTYTLALLLCLHATVELFNSQAKQQYQAAS